MPTQTDSYGFILSRHRTKMCRRMEERGQCKWRFCPFAHSESELVCPDFAKGKPCEPDCTKGLHIHPATRRRFHLGYVRPASVGTKPQSMELPYALPLPFVPLPPSLQAAVAPSRDEAREFVFSLIGAEYLREIIGKLCPVPHWFHAQRAAITAERERMKSDALRRQRRQYAERMGRGEDGDDDEGQPDLPAVDVPFGPLEAKLLRKQTRLLLNRNDSAVTARLLAAFLAVERAQELSDIRRYDLLDAAVVPATAAQLQSCGLGHMGRQGFHTIRVPGLAEKRPSVIPGDTVLVRCNSDARSLRRSNFHRGYVHETLLDDIVVHFDAGINPLVKKQSRFLVIFEVPPTQFLRSHRAVHAASFAALKAKGAALSDAKKEPREVAEHMQPGLWLSSTTALLETATPVALPATRGGDLPPCCASLNTQQQRFVRSALFSKKKPGLSPLALLHGPPGTGKTTTIVAAVGAVLAADPKARLLLCAPSNAAADLLVQRLAEVLRSMPAFADAAANRPCELLLRVQAAARRLAPDAHADLRRHCLQKERGAPFPPKESITKARVVVCTLSAATTLLSIGVPQQYTHVVVDEAGHATEQQLCAALCLATPTSKVVLAGDHKQLGPVLRSQAAALGMDRSPLQRLIEVPAVAGRCATVLEWNYRSHPDILALFNPWYGGRLLPKGSRDVTMPLHGRLSLDLTPAHKAVPAESPLRFLHVAGTMARDGGSPSWKNDEEVEAVVQAINAVVAARRVTVDEVTVVSPYVLQCHCLRRRLALHFANSTKESDCPVRVGSVEQLQGSEQKLIIITTVRTKAREDRPGLRRVGTAQSIGFLGEPQRLNVALSRAMAGLVIVGDATVLSRDKEWRRVIEHVDAKGGLVGVDIATVLETPVREQPADDDSELDSDEQPPSTDTSGSGSPSSFDVIETEADLAREE